MSTQKQKENKTKESSPHPPNIFRLGQLQHTKVGKKNYKKNVIDHYIALIALTPESQKLKQTNQHIPPNRGSG